MSDDAAKREWIARVLDHGLTGPGTNAGASQPIHYTTSAHALARCAARGLGESGRIQHRRSRRGRRAPGPGISGHRRRLGRDCGPGAKLRRRARERPRSGDEGTGRAIGRRCVEGDAARARRGQRLPPPARGGSPARSLLGVMAILRRQRPETVSKVRAGIERRLSNNRHARCKVGATVVHGADVKRRVRNSSNTATRIGRGPPAGVIRCSANLGADQS